MTQDDDCSGADRKTHFFFFFFLVNEVLGPLTSELGIVPRDQDLKPAPNQSLNSSADEKALVVGVRALAMVMVE